MVASLSPPTLDPPIIYPDSDGQPMAENTLQFEWIVIVKENLELLFGDRPDVFVAGDLLWYPVEGNNKIRRAPDAMVALGRPKGYRGSYKQWEEDGIAPQVVFEILSPGNRLLEMSQKFDFYQRYGVQEYYVYDPDRGDLSGWLRQNDWLTPIEGIEDWQSPLLNIRFQLSDSPNGDATARQLRLIRPDGQPFYSFGELDKFRRQAEMRAEEAEQRAQSAEQRASSAEEQAQFAEQRASSAEEKA
ncbi:MAG: Uma2 family endonuclease, partial [Microcystaceae cyanobacterium]